MSSGDDIDFEILIARSIRDFQPVKRLWPVGLRLALWCLLTTAILGVSIGFGGGQNPAGLVHNYSGLVPIALLLVASSVAAFLALKSAIPGREITWLELALWLEVAVLMAGGWTIFAFRPAGLLLSDEWTRAGPELMLQFLGFAAVPWLSLFWAVRRGVPMEPPKTGALVGLASSCFAFAVQRIISPSEEFPQFVIWPILAGVIVTAASAVAGNIGLNWIERWRQAESSEQPSTGNWRWLTSSMMFPAAMSTAVAATLAALVTSGQSPIAVPEFDLAVDSYQRALSDFRPNVPSGSIENVLTAYVERGMPAYMWDFGPAGFKLVGGRWQTLPNGSPVAYTWFRGTNSGIMCILKETGSFEPPSYRHEQHHHLLFYRYRGFSICLIDVGGYGNFISVVAAPMPMREFEHLVLATVL